MAYGEHGVFVVVHQEGDQGECQCHAPGAPAHRPGQAVPDRGSDSKRGSRGDHRVRTAHQFEQRQQQQAPRRGARQIVEVDPVHLLDGFADDGRDDGARGEEGQRRREVDQRQVPIGKIVSLRQQDGQRHHHEQAVDHAQSPEAREQRRLPGGHHIRKHAAQPQPEKRDGNREEGKVVIEHHREDAREGEFQQQRRHGGKSDAEVDLTPLAGIGFQRVQFLW